MGIEYSEGFKQFHLYNNNISYIMGYTESGTLLQLYAGKRLEEGRSYAYLHEKAVRPMTPYVSEEDPSFTLEHARQEYPSFGSTDFRQPAYEIIGEDGSRISNFALTGYQVIQGKPELPGLPATYTESEDEATTLELVLQDRVLEVKLTLLYTIFEHENAIARSARFENFGGKYLQLNSAMSLCLDLPDMDYEWIQFSGAWSREREVRKRRLEMGIQAVESMRGHSSHHQNPFVILKRPNADEFQGEAMGFSLVYSGNFLAQAEADTYGAVRMTLGINPRGFCWDLEPGETFQTPEAVWVYSDRGLNAMSQTFHRLYRTRLARGEWRDKVRPILINNWEATYFDFTEEKILKIAEKAKELGVELMVLDDGWFGKRTTDFAGLGDWYVNREKLPEGISGLSEKIEAMGMKFGLWFEPEMVNEDSDLYRAHPDWVLGAPGRSHSLGRHQMVLDFSRKEVVDHIFAQMSEILENAKISYIKWDMNRSITECFSGAYPAEKQGEIYHRYILGVYDLYERLNRKFPHILFESCASGGGRFDPGMLYYAPQAWTSDDTDAIERLKIQYGSSYAYPISSMGAHVSVSPNHQLGRVTPLSTRGNVAYFGAFGYELDLNKLTQEEQEEVRRQIAWVKGYRELIQKGTFYRLKSPFESSTSAAWMVVSEDKRQALVGYYKILNEVNAGFKRLSLKGLEPGFHYEIKGRKGDFTGAELQNAGLIVSDSSCSELNLRDPEAALDFSSRIYELTAVEE